MNRLRNRLILLFLAGTVLPLGLTIWFAVSLLERSLSYAATRELDEISKSLEKTGEFYQRSREMLKSDAEAGRTPPRRYRPADRDHWPPAVRGSRCSSRRTRRSPTSFAWRRTCRPPSSTPTSSKAC
jgi:hypothetical protein